MPLQNLYTVMINSRRYLLANDSKNRGLPNWDETDPWTNTVLKGILTKMAGEFGFDPSAEYLGIDQVWPLIVTNKPTP